MITQTWSLAITLNFHNFMTLTFRAVWIAAFFTTLYMAFVGALALVMYAYYSTCDPIASGRIGKADEVSM